MKFTVSIAISAGLFCIEQAVGQEQRVNPRPVERPSRAVETLMKRAEEAKAEGAKAEVMPEEGKKKEKEGAVVFRVSGGEVWEAARQAGWKFFPKGARGALDGVNTVAEVQPGLPFSLVQGPVMTQRRTPAGWGAISQNTFFLFTDANGRPKALAPGWTVRDLRLSGDPFRWINRPEVGGGSPSMVLQIAGGRNASDTVVRLEGMVLQGPTGSQDWREAFGER